MLKGGCLGGWRRNWDQSLLLAPEQDLVTPARGMDRNHDRLEDGQRVHGFRSTAESSVQRKFANLLAGRARDDFGRRDTMVQPTPKEVLEVVPHLLGSCAHGLLVEGTGRRCEKKTYRHVRPRFSSAP
jgi:hypothetical protein